MGETSWIRGKVPEALYIDLLETSAFIQLLAHPERLEQMIPKEYKNLIIIDEAQKLPALLNEVDRLIENKRYKFILAG